MPFGITARVEVDLSGIERLIDSELASAAQEAVNAAAEDLQRELRGQTVASGLGNGLANAWGLLRAGGTRPFSALVYSKAPRLHDAFIKGGTIRARNAQWLVLPLKAAVQYGLEKGRPAGASARGSDRRMSNIDKAIDLFGNLRFVLLLGGGRAVLFADPRNLNRPRGAKNYAGSTPQDIPLFLLVRSVNLAKRIDLDGAVAKARDRLRRNLSNITG